MSTNHGNNDRQPEPWVVQVSGDLGLEVEEYAHTQRVQQAHEVDPMNLQANILNPTQTDSTADDEIRTEEQEGASAPSRLARAVSRTARWVGPPVGRLCLMAAPLIAYVAAVLLPVNDFQATGVPSYFAQWLDSATTVVLLISFIGWLFFTLIYAASQTDPECDFPWYADRAAIFAFGLYIWAIGPTLANILTAIFATNG